jgi:hypothetical protein
MADKKSSNPDKDTTPTGYEIPIRSRKAVLADFRKVVAPPKAPRDRKKPKPA